jgi:hypothetical protein
VGLLDVFSGEITSREKIPLTLGRDMGHRGPWPGNLVGVKKFPTSTREMILITAAILARALPGDFVAVQNT